MKLNCYSTHGNVVGTVEVGEKKHDTGYTYKVYQNFEPSNNNKKEKTNGKA
jgi:hypothetical protein